MTLQHIRTYVMAAIAAIIMACTATMAVSSPRHPTLLIMNYGMSPVAVYMYGSRIGTAQPGTLMTNCIDMSPMAADMNTALTFKALGEKAIEAPPTNLHSALGWSIEVQHVNYNEMLSLQPAPRCR